MSSDRTPLKRSCAGTSEVTNECEKKMGVSCLEVKGMVDNQAPSRTRTYLALSNWGLKSTAPIAFPTRELGGGAVTYLLQHVCSLLFC